MRTSLIQNIDYYISPDGNYIFTEKYHLERGYCCQSGCFHCPYGCNEKIDPNIPAEFRNTWIEENGDEEE